MRYLRNTIRIAVCAAALILLSQAVFAAGLAGRWDAALNTAEGGIRQSGWEFKVQGEQVILVMDGQDLPGTFRDGQLEIAGELYSSEAGYAATFKLSGKMEGDKLVGKGSWDTYQMTFEASRAAAAPPAKSAE